MNCNEHIQSIQRRMAEIPGIVVDNFGLSAHLGNHLSPACKACKENQWTVVYIGKACNANCYFCPQTHNKPALNSKDDTDGILATCRTKDYSAFLLIKLKNAVAKKIIRAIGYSGGEPLLYLDRIRHYVEELGRVDRELYQYLYTNGISVTRDKIKELKDIGIREIRFNLAATNFSDEIINKMEYVKEFIPFLTIEVPAIKDILSQIKKHIYRFIDLGVVQINLSEATITRHNQHYFKDGDYYYLDATVLEDIKKGAADSKRILNCYPVNSRHITYDVMSLAAKEKWPITINDCSHLNHIKPFNFGL